ncbi:MAG: cysteine--tRNA ligase [Acidimicrobiia bacterium]
MTMTSTITLNLFDQTKNRINPLELVDKATIYTCGVTPYDASHLGHVATFTYFDVLVRLIKSKGLNVQLVRNVTDLDDPLFERARTSGENVESIVKRNVEQLDEDLNLLNCIPATHEPYSSQYVNEIISMIENLNKKGYTYTVDGWTYFDTSKRKEFPEFEILKTMQSQTLENIAFERGSTRNDPKRKNNLDFVLWKPSLEDEPSYESPFGSGRPGWHIECSVMCTELLGDTVDIHGGGDDLIFPHHACEVAQSESATEKEFVRHFMHIAPISYEGEKMSKSLGNLVYADTIIHEIGEMCTRMMLLKHHYREGFEHTSKDAHEAQDRCARWSKCCDIKVDPQEGELYAQVFEALIDDLNTPKALELIDEAIEQIKHSNEKDIDLIANVKAARALLGFK